MEKMEIMEKIRLAILRTDKKEQDIADAAGIHVNTIYNVKNQTPKAGMSLESLVNLCRALKLRIYVMADDEEAAVTSSLDSKLPLRPIVKTPTLVVCQKCGEDVYSVELDDGTPYRFCPRCSQAIDWGYEK